MAKQSVVVDGITLTRAQVEKAHEDLNKPDLNKPELKFKYGQIVDFAPGSSDHFNVWLYLDKERLRRVLSEADKYDYEVGLSLSKSNPFYGQQLGTIPKRDSQTLFNYEILDSFTIKGVPDSK